MKNGYHGPKDNITDKFESVPDQMGIGDAVDGESWTQLPTVVKNRETFSVIEMMPNSPRNNYHPQKDKIYFGSAKESINYSQVKLDDDPYQHEARIEQEREKRKLRSTVRASKHGNS